MLQCDFKDRPGEGTYISRLVPSIERYEQTTYHEERLGTERIHRHYRYDVYDSLFCVWVGRNVPKTQLSK